MSCDTLYGCMASASGYLSLDDVVAFGLYVEYQQPQLAVDFVENGVVALPNFVQFHDQCQSIQVNVKNAEVVSVVVGVVMSTGEARNIT